MENGKTEPGASSLLSLLYNLNKQISGALVAAIANEPYLILPLQKCFFEMLTKIVAAGALSDIGTYIRLTLDGMWISDIFGFAPLSHEWRENIIIAILEIAQRKDQNSYGDYQTGSASNKKSGASFSNVFL